MAPRDNREAKKSIASVDLDAARRALARNWPDLEQDSSKYAAYLEALAGLHCEFGAEDFELRYNLRPPKDKVEEWTRQLMHGVITDAEYASRLKQDAERPIDLEMLRSVCDAYEATLGVYSRILQDVTPRPSRQGDASAAAELERKINEHVYALSAKLPIWSQHLEIVFEFLDEVRAESGRGLVTLGEFEATSAHWLAQLVFTRTTQCWKSCKEVAHRSRTDDRYLYAATATELFVSTSLAMLPNPQSLHERMREEYTLARIALRRRSQVVPVMPIHDVSETTASSQPAVVDNESRELLLVGEVMSIVARAGHIFRPIPNSDWGIDGEIEFKDTAGYPDGRRVYLQLKSGDSHLVARKRDNAEVFRVKKARHVQYWQQQAFPVMLVIRKSDGSIRWMDVRAYVLATSAVAHEQNREIIFSGEPFTAANVQSLADRLMKPNGD